MKVVSAEAHKDVLYRERKNWRENRGSTSRQ